MIGDEVQATAFIFNQEDRGDIQQRLVSIDEAALRARLPVGGLEDGAEEAMAGVWPLP